MKFLIIVSLFIAGLVTFNNIQLKSEANVKRNLAMATIARTYGEGVLSKNHSSDFIALKNKYILSNGKIDLAKVASTIQFLKNRRKQLYNSIFLNEKEQAVRRFGYKDKKAHEKALEEIEGGESFLFLYDIAANALKNLKEDSTMNEVNRISLFITSAEDFHQTHLLSEEVNVIKSFRNFFKKIKLDDINAVEASNLVKDGKSLSSTDIFNLKTNKFDISDLNPASGPIWVNNKVENYDPYNEKFYDKGRIPEKGVELHYKRMGRGQVKLKAYYLNKKGKKRSVTIKLGREAHPQLYTSQMARILGYTSLPIVFRKNIKMYLGETSYSEFTTAWDKAHVGNTASQARRTWFSRAGQYTYDKNTHSVTFQDGFLEAYPSKGKYYYKGGPFRSSKHGFVNRREYRALLLFSALVNLVDNGDKNIRMDAFRNSESEPWVPLFYFNDLGTAMGRWYSAFNTMSVNEFGGKVAYKKKNGKVHLKYISRHPNSKTYKTSTASDYKWLIKRMARITPKQLNDIGLASGLPPFLAELYAEKIKRRINNLISAFEVNSKKLSITSYESLHDKFPKYISKSGKLKPEADNFDNNSWHTGPSATLTEIIKQEGSNYVHDAVSSLLKLKLPVVGEALFYNQTGGAVSLTGVRNIRQNNFHGPSQRRVKIQDTWSWGFSLGASPSQKLSDPNNKSEFYLPLGLNLNYEVSHIHSAATIKEANLKDYSSVILPWNFTKIKENLKIGDSVRIIESKNFTVGGIKGQISDQIRLQLDALRFLKIKSKEIYIHRVSRNEVEMVIQNIVDETDIRSGFDIKIFLELALSIGQKKVKTNYDYLRLDLDKFSEQEIQSLYSKILKTRNIKDLQKEIGAHTSLVKSEKEKYFGWKLLLWGYDSSRVNTTYSLNGIENRVSDADEPQENKYQIYSHSTKRTFTKAISNVWDEGQVSDNDIKERNILNGLNILFQFFDKQNSIDISTYLQANKKSSEIKDLMIFVKVNRSNNYIATSKFKKKYIDYFSKVVGEDPETYFDYKVSDEQKYLSPVRSQLDLQISFKGIQNVISKAEQRENFCNKDINCENNLANAVKLIKYTKSLLNKKYSLKNRKEIITKKLYNLSSFFEYLVGHKAYKIKQLRELAGNKNIWMITRINGVLPGHHPFAVARSLPLYAKEIGNYQGRSPLKKVALKYQFLPKQNLFYDSLLPDVPY